MTLADPLPDPAWGPLIGGYFVLIGLPGGLGLAAWWLARDGHLDRRSGRHANLLSLAALVVVAVILTIDLGRPERFFLMLTRFGRIESPIAVGAKLIAVETALAGFTAYLEYRPLPAAAERYSTLSNAARATPGLVGALSFALAVYPAAVLSRTWSSPLSGSSGAALLYLLTALLMGAATLFGLITYLNPVDPPPATATVLRRLLTPLITVYAIAWIFEGLAVNGDPRHSAEVTVLTSGADSVAFWGGVVAVGIALPGVLLVAGSRRRATRIATAGALLAGACTARYLLFATHA